MRFRSVVVLAVLCAVVSAGVPAGRARAQQGGASAQSGATPYQRLEVVRQKLEAMRRSLSTAVANLGGAQEKKDKKDAAAATNDAAARLRGLDKEVGALLSEVADLRGKVDRSERYDPTEIDKLEGATTELNDRVSAALRETAGERRTGGAPVARKSSSKKKTGLIGRLLGRGGNNEEIDELTGTVAPGRDRELFAVGARYARKGDYEGARLLFSVIINTYPESPFLPYAKLAIADTFYLEGTTSALIQAGTAYQDWLTYFPTDLLAERAMLKMGEVEMRQMGLPSRTIEHARKAEQRLKAALQQFPQTSLRPDFEIRLQEVQENLAMHNYQVGNFYLDRYNRQLAPNPKGAQSRYREIVEKYPNFSLMADVLYKLGTTYMQEEEPDEAAKAFQQLLRTHPNSEFAEKAKAQLEAIGAPVPEPDKNAVLDEPEKPGMMAKISSEVLGRAEVTVDKDGVLISRDSKETADLIDKVLNNNGQLVPGDVPGATPSPRILLKPRPTPAPTPQKDATGGVKLTPTQPGPPATGSDPTKPASTPPPGQ
ncbi:MAG TPA: outer membrane protein assembly factor BamD [Pyrinomonadaceae bacterium]|jgi:outer membrane protein assembly factor BamD